jgi:low temperature requirement protein LtrA
MTIIVLGESVLAATVAIQRACADGGRWELIPVVASAPVILFSMWWLYFARPHHDLLRTMRAAFVWGYGHYAIFAAAAAVGAGLAVAVDAAMHDAHVDSFQAGLAIAIPVAVYLASLWALAHCGRRHTLAFGSAIAVVLAAPVLPLAPVAISVVLVLLLVRVVRAAREPVRNQP